MEPVKQENLDSILGTEEELAPSSGFVSAVMERVREEAAAPKPIPFPWKRVMPGAVVAIGGLLWIGVEVVRHGPGGLPDMGVMAAPWMHASLQLNGNAGRRGLGRGGVGRVAAVVGAGAPNDRTERADLATTQWRRRRRRWLRGRPGGARWRGAGAGLHWRASVLPAQTSSGAGPAKKSDC